MKINAFLLAFFLIIMPTLLLAEPEAENPSPSCQVFASVQASKTVDEVKKNLGTQYKLELRGYSYNWSTMDGYSLDATFYKDGHIQNSFGNMSEQMKRATSGSDVTLSDVEAALGPGRVAGALYQINFPDGSYILLQTNNKNEVIFRFSSVGCQLHSAPASS